MRTLYLIDRVALRDRWLICRRGLVFVGAPDGSAWHGVIYDSTPGALEGRECDAPLPFTATTPDGVWLEGVVQVGIGDEQTRMLYLTGVGMLRESEG